MLSRAKNQTKQVSL